jgi:hypothetical protein
MNDRTNRDRLVSDLFSDPDALRASSLARGLTEIRRVRRRRQFTRLLAGTALLVLGTGWLTGKFTQKQNLVLPKTVTADAMRPASGVKILTDDELLDQFPGRAVALVGGPDRRRLVFLDVRAPGPSHRAE